MLGAHFVQLLCPSRDDLPGAQVAHAAISDVSPSPPIPCLPGTHFLQAL